MVHYLSDEAEDKKEQNTFHWEMCHSPGISSNCLYPPATVKLMHIVT